MPKDAYINTIKEVDVYKKLTVSDLVNKTNTIITNKDEVIKTNKLGEYEADIFYKYKDKKYLYQIKYKVVDKEKPRIFSGPTKTVYVGHDYDFCNKVFHGDNYDKNPKCKLKGEYDINTPGNYKITMIVTDNSGNFEDFNFTLRVIEKLVETDNKENNNNNNNIKEENQILFSDLLNEYKEDNNELGIDLSVWQGNVDMAKVSSTGASFVMLRLGIQSDNDKEISVDKYFETNYRNALDNNLKVGVYVYSSATDKKTAIKHAKWTLKVLDKRKLDLPVVFDWENWHKWNKYKISFHDINEIANTFIDNINKGGYEGMLYSSKFYLESIWDNTNDYPVWLAHYTKKSNYKGKYMMWQLTDKATIPGVDSLVDVNILYK